MEQYLINDLERLTGIKAHTIRIWEKRYKLIKPSRTATNRRYYSGEQLRKLMNVSTLLSQGYKISSVAGLSEHEINSRIEEMERSNAPDVVSAAYVHDLTLAMLAFDEVGFERVFSAAATRFGFYESMLTVFYPLLKRIGMLWSVDKAMPVQEHFASSIIRRKIIAATDGLLPPDANAKTFLMYLPQGEWHEIGLLFANYIIRSVGGKTIYLGQSVPQGDLEQVVKVTQPYALFTFYITQKPTDEIQQDIDSISARYPELKVFISGNLELLSTIQFASKNVSVLTDVGAAIIIVS